MLRKKDPTISNDRISKFYFTNFLLPIAYCLLPVDYRQFTRKLNAVHISLPSCL